MYYKIDCDRDSTPPPSHTDFDTSSTCLKAGNQALRLHMHGLGEEKSLTLKAEHEDPEWLLQPQSAAAGAFLPSKTTQLCRMVSAWDF